MGAGGRDFHDFNTVFRNDASSTVVAFTAAQIPWIDRRTYPAVLAGPRYPDGIPIEPEEDLRRLVEDLRVDEVVLAYSDLSHAEVMHKASLVHAAGADFRLLGPASTMLASTKPVVAVCATRTGCGKSPTSRKLIGLLQQKGLRVVLVRHPMPYGDLTAMAVQRFGSIAELDAAGPTIEEREEYEAPIEAGIVVYAGVDYEAILRRAEQEADVICWDGGNNDFPFYRPDLLITVVDPLRAGDEVAYHPGETNLRMADVVLVNKVDSATSEQVDAVLASVRALNPAAAVIRAASPVTIAGVDSLAGRKVLVVEDGPSLTHGNRPFGAGTVAARQLGAELVDPRPYAVGSLAAVFDRWPHLGALLPAMGYRPEQVEELARTIASTPCDAIVTGTPIDLGHLIGGDRPILRARYEVAEIGEPNLDTVLAPYVARWGA